MTIRVTDANIWDGKKHNPRQCPMALAMKDAGIEDAFAASVCVGKIGEERIFFQAPNSAVLFMERYDRGMAVSPFSFDLATA